MYLIRKLLGYEKLENIKIPYKFRKTSPTKLKMEIKKEYYNKHKKFQSQVIVNKNNKLIDGYTTYLIAKQEQLKYIKVVRVS